MRTSKPTPLWDWVPYASAVFRSLAGWIHITCNGGQPSVTLQTVHVDAKGRYRDAGAGLKVDESDTTEFYLNLLYPEKRSGQAAACSVPTVKPGKEFLTLQTNPFQQSVPPYQDQRSHPPHPYHSGRVSRSKGVEQCH